MTLDEAIKHAEEVAEENENVANTGTFEDGHTVAEIYCDDTECIDAHLARCRKCAKEYRQLAEWLSELKVYKERMPSYEAGYNDAKREIALSGEYERAYERGKADAQTERWIPVSERLPKYNTPVLLALKQIGKERAIVIGERRTRKSGWYFVDIAAYDTEHEVIAWMPLPEPYKPQESEK